MATRGRLVDGTRVDGTLVDETLVDHSLVRESYLRLRSRRLECASAATDFQAPYRANALEAGALP